MSDRLIIGIGDSFLQGAEAGGEEASFLAQYASICNADYINLGTEGVGNLGSVLNLFMYDLGLSDYQEKYLIWMPTSLSRVDYLNPKWVPKPKKTFNEFLTIFPNTDPPNVHGEEHQQLCKIWAKIGSQRSENTTFLLSYKLLKQFCHANGILNYKIFPSFTNEYKQEKFLYFDNHLYTSIQWTDIVTVGGHSNMFDWCVKELLLLEEEITTFDIIDKKVEHENLEKYFHERGHPTRLAHTLFARALAQEHQL